jgi:hypothetical protein
VPRSERSSSDVALAKAGTSVLCVHFTREWDEYSLWLAVPDAEQAMPAPGFAAAWQQRESGMLWGEVSYRHAAACDAIFIDERHAGATWQHVRDLLRAEGTPRQCAAILARLPERPLLATIARGPAMSPDMVRRMHATLLGDLLTRRGPAQQAARA